MNARDSPRWNLFIVLESLKFLNTQESTGCILFIKNHKILVCCLEYISLLSIIIGFDQKPPNFCLLSNLQWYKEKFLVDYFLKTIESIINFHVINWCSIPMASNILSNFKVNLDCTKVIFYKRKIGRYGVYIVKK